MKTHHFMLTLLLFCACSSGKTVTQTGIEEIRFGSGGGFTGKVITYTLTADGKLYENEKTVKKIDKQKTIELFNQAKEMNDIHYFKPDNIYQFVEIKSKTASNRIVWGYNADIDQKIIILYNNLISLKK